MKMARVTLILLACASSAGASLRASVGKAKQPAPDSLLVRGDPYADNDDFDAPDFADDDREPNAEEEDADEEPLRPLAPVRKLQLHQVGVDHSPLPWEDNFVPMARPADVQASAPQALVPQPQPVLRKLREPTVERAAQRSTLPREDGSDPAYSEFAKLLDEPTYISAGPRNAARPDGGGVAVPEDSEGFVPMARPAIIISSVPEPQPVLHKPHAHRVAQRPAVPRDDGSNPASTDFFKMMDEPTYLSAGPHAAASPDGGGASLEDAAGDGEGEMDTDAMMMYYQGKVKTMEGQNKHLKGMLSKAATWGKGMKQRAAELEAQRKLNAQLRAEVQSFQVASAKVQDQLQVEQKRESVLEDNVKALQWVEDQRAAARRDNAALKQRLDNATRAGDNLQVQLAASKHDRDAADAAQQQAVADLKAERQEFQAKQKELALAKAAEAKEETELAAESKSGAEVGELKEVVEQRNQLLRKGLNQLVSERDQEQKLRDHAAEQEKELQAQLAAAHSNTTALEKKLAEQSAKEQELEKAVAMTRAHALEGEAEQKKAAKAARRAHAELARVKAVDKRIQANTNWLKKQAADERLAAQNATQEAEHADEARLAARKELANADSVINRLKQQHAAAMAENTKLTRAIAKAKKESAQLRQDTAAPPDNAHSSANSPVLDGADTEPVDTEPDVATEDAPDDLPTMDVVAP